MEYSPTTPFPTTFDAEILEGKSILITGGASGLGAGCARKFAEAGAFVTIADLNQESGLALEAELNSNTNLGAKFVQCDVSSWKSQVEAFKTAISSSPSKSIDTVIAAAGISGGQIDLTTKPSDSDEDPPEPPLTCLKVDLFGVHYTSQLACYYAGQELTTTSPSTNPQNSIVIIGSLAGYHVVSRSVEYTTAKYGIRGILKSLKTETEAIGLRLNIIAPTFVRTPMITEEIAANLEKLGIRMAEPEKAVEAVMVLATQSNINGRSICVGANGNFDLQDDHEGMNGGLMFQKYAEEMEADEVKRKTAAVVKED